MRTRTKYAVATVAATGALAVGAPLAAHADGILSDNNIGANICGTDVNIIAEESGRTNCVNKIHDKGGNGEENGEENGGEDDGLLGLGLGL